MAANDHKFRTARLVDQHGERIAPTMLASDAGLSSPSAVWPVPDSC
jgi:hypothetical protein